MDTYSLALAGDFLIACRPDLEGDPDRAGLHSAIGEWLEEDEGDLNLVVVHTRVLLTDDPCGDTVIYEAGDQMLHDALGRPYRYAVRPDRQGYQH